MSSASSGIGSLCTDHFSWLGIEKFYSLHGNHIRIFHHNVLKLLHAVACKYMELCLHLQNFNIWQHTYSYRKIIMYEWTINLISSQQCVSNWNYFMLGKNYFEMGSWWYGPRCKLQVRGIMFRVANSEEVGFIPCTSHVSPRIVYSLLPFFSPPNNRYLVM